MAKLGISTGITPNDGTGDSLLLGAIKINSNFSDIYTYFGDGTNLTSIGGTWGNTSVGIHTLKNVGIGTTNPTSALTVTGNGTFTGVVTATTFIGNLTGTATTSTLATNAQGLTGTPNLNVGVVTATTFVGNVTGTATTATLSINSQGLTGTPDINVGVATASTLNVGTGGTIITTTTAGLVGIGTTNPIEKLTVVGVTSSTSFYGDASYTASGRWTLGANGSADYTFTGIGFTQTTNDPVLYLARGRVYEFVNNSGGSHPFQIRVSDGGSAYSNGVTNNGGASGVIRFEIPFNAPNTLYYQCTAHSGMGNTISVYPNTI